MIKKFFRGILSTLAVVSMCLAVMVPAPAEARKARTVFAATTLYKGVRKPLVKSMIQPRSFSLGFKPFGARQVKAVDMKIKTGVRDVTRLEYKTFRSTQRFQERRREGIFKFWSQERAALKAGQPGSRNWTADQRKAILDRKTPTHDGKAIVGHHRYSAAKYPHLANEPRNIRAVTQNEHVRREHGGSFRNETRGAPLNPKYPREF